MSWFRGYGVGKSDGRHVGASESASASGGLAGVEGMGVLSLPLDLFTNSALDLELLATALRDNRTPEATVSAVCAACQGPTGGAPVQVKKKVCPAAGMSVLVLVLQSGNVYQILQRYSRIGAKFSPHQNFAIPKFAHSPPSYGARCFGAVTTAMQAPVVAGGALDAVRTQCGDSTVWPVQAAVE